MLDPLMKPIPRAGFGTREAAHLLNRAGFGGTPDQVGLIARWGPDRAVEHLIGFTETSYPPPKADEFESDIMTAPTPEQQLAIRRARQSGDEAVLEAARLSRQDRQRRDRRQIRNMQQWWLTRMIETDRPLEEKMTLFFHGHFATGYRTIENSYHMFVQNQLFRAHATGNFADLCFRIIRDPAMLAYLDNNESNKDHPNENLAREFMELFTLGEGVAYTENDIKEGARALTGYSFHENDFVMLRNAHDTGSKHILGQRGQFNGDDFVRIVLGRTECSEYICYKLYRYFVSAMSDGPTREQERYIKGLARLLRDSRYELAPVLETMFKSRHFYDVAVRGSQIKSPVQLIVQAIRSMKVPPADLSVLVEALGLMGQNLFQPPSVKGWDGGRSWINTSTLFVRQNVLVYLLTGRLPGASPALGARTKFDGLRLLRPLVDTADPDTASDAKITIEQAVMQLMHLCLPPIDQEPDESQMATLIKYAQEQGTDVTNELVIELLCLITALPEYQLC